MGLQRTKVWRGSIKLDNLHYQISKPKTYYKAIVIKSVCIGIGTEI